MGHADGRIDALKARHREIDEQIEEIQSRPYWNDLDVAKLKKSKLAIKEEIDAMGGVTA